MALSRCPVFNPENSRCGLTAQHSGRDHSFHAIPPGPPPTPPRPDLGQRYEDEPMKTVNDTMTDIENECKNQVLWAMRLEKVVLSNPVECHCWDRGTGRNASQGHTGDCAEWREVASAIRTKPSMSPGPVRMG